MGVARPPPDVAPGRLGEPGARVRAWAFPRPVRRDPRDGVALPSEGAGLRAEEEAVARQDGGSSTASRTARRFPGRTTLASFTRLCGCLFAPRLRRLRPGSWAPSAFFGGGAVRLLKKRRTVLLLYIGYDANIGDLELVAE